MSPTVIPCLFQESKVNLGTEAAPLHLISKDWFGEVTPYSVNFSLLTDSRSLLFTTWVRLDEEFPLNFDSSYGSNDYVEGLWKQDVVELFLGQNNSNFYQEFNLAPSGAWWSHLFTGYRDEAANFKKPSGIQTACSISENMWEARLFIPLAELAIPGFRLERCTCNVNAILGEEPRHYFSMAKLSSPQPDFHLVDEFLPLQDE